MTGRYLDARWLICPLPVLKARKLLLGMRPGDILTIAATDRNALKDFPLFCEESGHFYGGATDSDGFVEISVTRGQYP